MKRSWPHAILVTAALLSSTSALADETPDGPLEPAAAVEEPPEPRPQYVSQRRWGLFSIGAGVFGAAWVGNLLDTLNLGKYEGMIPVAGPFLLLDGKAATGTNVFHVLDGVAQIAIVDRDAVTARGPDDFIDEFGQQRDA